jgi:hypothetical protein
MITSAFSQCVNQKYFEVKSNVTNNNFKFNIKRIDGDSFNVLLSKKNKPVEIKGIILLNNKFKKPIEMNIDELIRNYGNDVNKNNQISKTSEMHRGLIVEKVEWKNYKDITVNIDYLALFQDKNKEYFKFFTVLIHNNKNECSYFESDTYFYDVNEGGLK